VLAEYERSLELFGSHVRVLVGAPRTATGLAPELAALEAEALLERIHAELTRFDPRSELSRLNLDMEPVVTVGGTLGALIEAAIGAARSTNGLVDSSLVGPLELCGYARSRAGESPADLRDALAAVAWRRPATPAVASLWGDVAIDPRTREVTRPPGMRFDSGGLGKGLAADLAADLLAGYSTFAVDCGGDLRIGGTERQARTVSVRHPFQGGEAIHFEIGSGGIATSGLRSRIWRDGDRYNHHLIDPGTGRPAWTGLIQATALAPTATEAEVLAKAALLEGPIGGRERLSRYGGYLVADSGSVERVKGSERLVPSDVGTR
jgi:thiamine biosynthesis lipoprotein